MAEDCLISAGSRGLKSPPHNGDLLRFHFPIALGCLDNEFLLCSSRRWIRCFLCSING
jgi:hypothetical protein